MKIYSSINKSKKQAKHFTLEIAKYFKARIPNNYFDTMQLITSASDLIFDKPDIIDWTNEEVVSWINLLGLDKYAKTFGEEKIDGIQFIKCNLFDLKTRFRINDLRDLKLLLKSVDFLRIFIKLKKDYQNFIDLERLNVDENKPENKNIEVFLERKNLNKINEEANENNHDTNRNNENLIFPDDQALKEDPLNASIANRSKKHIDIHSEKGQEVDAISNKEVSEDNTYINDNQVFNITKISISKIFIQHSKNAAAQLEPQRL
jgi:hypothetical protein